MLWVERFVLNQKNVFYNLTAHERGKAIFGQAHDAQVAS